MIGDTIQIKRRILPRQDRRFIVAALSFNPSVTFQLSKNGQLFRMKLDSNAFALNKRYGFF
jgi:hypothetical protein